MKAKSTESDIPGTFKLRHNCVSILVTSAVHFPVLGNPLRTARAVTL